MKLVLAALLSWQAVFAGCRKLSGDRILARDLAAAVPVFQALDPSTPLAFSPLPGSRRVFFTADLRRLAARHNLTWEGTAEVCFEPDVEMLDPGRLLPLLHQSLGAPGAVIEILDYSRFAIPKGTIEFPRSGLSAPRSGAEGGPALWRGHVRDEGRRSVPVWVRVRVRAPRARLVAAENLPAGSPIREGQVAVESSQGFPFPALWLDRVEQAVGRAPRRLILKGQPVSGGMLVMPKEVEAGDTVEVEVQSGAARLRLKAKAETGGHAGEGILVRNPGNGRRFRAVVQEKGLVKVETDAQSVEHATKHRDEDPAGAAGAGGALASGGQAALAGGAVGARPLH